MFVAVVVFQLFLKIFRMENEELPLIDEINELLIKERTLLGLKVVEQKIETEEWKEKYENLINKINQNNEKNEIEIFEIIGEIESNKNNKINKNKENNENIKENKENNENNNLYSFIGLNLDRLLHFQYSTKYFWCINTSNLYINRNEIKKLLKYPKSYNANNIKVLQLNHSNLQDSDSDLIILLLHYPSLECLDLSHNELGSEFRSILIQTIQVRS